MLCYVMLCHLVSCHVICYDVMSSTFMPCYVMLCYLYIYFSASDLFETSVQKDTFKYHVSPHRVGSTDVN